MFEVDYDYYEPDPPPVKVQNVRLYRPKTMSWLEVTLPRPILLKYLDRVVEKRFGKAWYIDKAW